ncbi:uncharacterized protein PFL1_02658 [Pseudozyma flocculosa PF-1]|uniref:Uncharacterized protein n=1 Tax=Pseudozyma flocculosa PF-1 TaxID=1277687 RepID=A0A061HD68_9BASI|nr:uncharacterized protein PFL1_02658 [Pseudozyma flocculosa PF-1]EPQ29985.1 hypothetical protein PFL1_02658 [Pseudozyma flocculosa PF-1]
MAQKRPRIRWFGVSLSRRQTEASRLALSYARQSGARTAVAIRGADLSPELRSGRFRLRDGGCAWLDGWTHHATPTPCHSALPSRPQARPDRCSRRPPKCHHPGLCRRRRRLRLRRICQGHKGHRSRNRSRTLLGLAGPGPGCQERRISQQKQVGVHLAAVVSVCLMVIDHTVPPLPVGKHRPRCSMGRTCPPQRRTSSSPAADAGPDSFVRRAGGETSCYIPSRPIVLRGDDVHSRPWPQASQWYRDRSTYPPDID